MTINTYFEQLEGNYLFKEIEDRRRAYQQAHPQAHLLALGVGDVTRPLSKPVVEAMHQAVEELAHAETFRGYGPEDGYPWLKQCILDHDYAPLGIHWDLSEIFISDGAGSDIGNLSELFDHSNIVAVQDPVYPAYVDTSIMAGRKIIHLPCTAEHGFLPQIPQEHVDLIYLCSPNNPTGVALSYNELKQWIDYAKQHHAIILYDAAYKAFISSPDIPRTIYEIEGAQEVAIEICSFSKTAGFTSVRCGYTIVPKQTGLQAMWLRRQCTKYNGTSYIAQRAAQAVYSPKGQEAVRADISYYLETAQLLYNGLTDLGLEVYGGRNAPYIWCRTPKGMKSWAFFEKLLQESEIVCTPGVGFGSCGEGYVRFSAFSSRSACTEAIQRMKEKLKN